MLKIAIVGSHFGIIGHLPAFQTVRGCKVVAIAGKQARLPKNIRHYSDWRTMLRNEQLDALAVAVPPTIQYEVIKAALNRGLPVFAEKPLAPNLAQAKELFAIAKKKKVVHVIDFEFPEINEWKKVKELLDKKTFGTLKHVSVDWDWLSGDLKYGRKTWKTSVKEGGGALAFYFSHGLHYLEHFAGTITETKSIFTLSPKSRNGGEVGVDMLLKFKGGITGNVHVSCNSPGLISHRLMFLCERGIIVLENHNAIVNDFVVRTYDENGEKIVQVAKDKSRKGEDERVKIVRKLAERFVRACTSKKQMTPSFANGLRVHELIEKIRTTGVSR